MDAWQPLWLFFYNYTYAPLFILFGIALFAFFNGAVALKTRTWSGFGLELRGTQATTAGWCLLLVGIGALVGIVLLLAANPALAEPRTLVVAADTTCQKPDTLRIAGTSLNQPVLEVVSFLRVSAEALDELHAESIPTDSVCDLATIEVNSDRGSTTRFRIIPASAPAGTTYFFNVERDCRTTPCVLFWRGIDTLETTAR